MNSEGLIHTQGADSSSCHLQEGMIPMPLWDSIIPTDKQYFS